MPIFANFQQLILSIFDSKFQNKFKILIKICLKLGKKLRKVWLRSFEDFFLFTRQLFFCPKAGFLFFPLLTSRVEIESLFTLFFLFFMTDQKTTTTRLKSTASYTIRGWAQVFFFSRIFEDFLDFFNKFSKSKNLKFSRKKSNLKNCTQNPFSNVHTHTHTHSHIVKLSCIKCRESWKGVLFQPSPLKFSLLLLANKNNKNRFLSPVAFHSPAFIALPFSLLRNSRKC